MILFHQECANVNIYFGQVIYFIIINFKNISIKKHQYFHTSNYCSRWDWDHFCSCESENRSNMD